MTLGREPVVLGENIKVVVDSNRLRVSSTGLHFLTGRPLDRLRDGRTVTYALQLLVRSERAGRILTRIAERFAFSYDLWEEKFSVTRLATPTRSASNPSSGIAESWCLDNLSIPITAIPADRQFWVGLEYASEEPGDNKADAPGLTLSSLIDIFSRRPRDDQQVRGASEEVGPLRLQDLMKESK